MNPCRKASSSALMAFTLVAVWALLFSLVTAGAQPAETRRSTTPQSSSVARVGPARISLTATDLAVPRGGAFSYQAAVRTSRPLDFLQVRMKLFMPSGRLVYQKTYIDRSDKVDPRSFLFERSIADIDLEPSAYPIELSIRVVVDGEQIDQTLVGALLVYDPEVTARPTALVARISAIPLTDSDGRFVIDPASAVRARDDVIRLSDYVLADADARISVSLSPLMLEEWRRASGGYTYEGPEGPIEVPSTDETPRSYAYALERLTLATGTGRLEVLSSGYSDPDLSELEAAGLQDDIETQYEMGVSALFASIGTTPTAGTAPANGCFSDRIAPELEKAGVRYAIVSDACVPGAEPGAYAARSSGLTLLVAERGDSSAFATGTVDAIVARVFEGYLKPRVGPVPLVVTVGNRGVSAEKLIRVARAVSAQPWTSLVNVGTVAREKRPITSVTLRRSRATAPKNYWSTVSESRRLSSAVTAALGAEDEEAMFVQRNSIIAEAGAWRGVEDDWAHSERALGFASKARSSAEAILGRVVVNAKPVTLAGTKGEVPITIVNNGDKMLKVRVISTPSGTMKKGVAPVIELALNPQDNFIEIPVDLQGGLSGRLQVVVMAGDVQVAQTTVSLSASVMDRLVILAGIVALLGGLLAFIILRVRRFEASRDGAPVSGER